jgi:uncharacterized membrane protein YgcG
VEFSFELVMDVIQISYNEYTMQPFFAEGSYYGGIYRVKGKITVEVRGGGTPSPPMNCYAFL